MSQTISFEVHRVTYEVTSHENLVNCSSLPQSWIRHLGLFYDLQNHRNSPNWFKILSNYKIRIMNNNQNGAKV